MIRVILPLAIVAAMFFGPFFSETTSGSSTGDRTSMVAGSYFIEEAVNCVRTLNYSGFAFGDECASDAEYNGSNMSGSVLSGAAKISIAAALLGIVGILPFIGRVTSIATIGAGLTTLGALGYFMMSAMRSADGLASIQWGAYLAAGLGLLTLISGLSGVRGR